MADSRSTGAASLSIKVVAGASRSEIAGWSAGRLRVRVSAVAERGKANAALIKLLAKHLGLPVSALRVTAGKTSPRKTLAVAGLSETELLSRLPSR